MTKNIDNQNSEMGLFKYFNMENTIDEKIINRVKEGKWKQ